MKRQGRLELPSQKKGKPRLVKVFEMPEDIRRAMEELKLDDDKDNVPPSHEFVGK